MTKIGRTQAEALADFFSEVRIRRVLASEYQRAHQTALPLAKAKCLNVETDARLNEIDNSVIELMTVDEVRKQYPDFRRDYRSRETDCRFPGSETGLEVTARQDSLLQDLLAGRTSCVLFTHKASKSDA